MTNKKSGDKIILAIIVILSIFFMTGSVHATEINIATNKTEVANMLYKISNYEETLKGSRFELYNSNNELIDENIIKDEKVIFRNVKEGSYTIESPILNFEMSIIVDENYINNQTYYKEISISKNITQDKEMNDSIDGNKNIDSDKTPLNVIKTGDNSNIMFLITTMGVSCAAFIVLRRRKYD